MRLLGVEAGAIDDAVDRWHACMRPGASPLSGGSSLGALKVNFVRYSNQQHNDTTNYTKRDRHDGIGPSSPHSTELGGFIMRPQDFFSSRI